MGSEDESALVGFVRRAPRVWASGVAAALSPKRRAALRLASPALRDATPRVEGETLPYKGWRDAGWVPTEAWEAFLSGKTPAERLVARLALLTGCSDHEGHCSELRERVYPGVVEEPRYIPTQTEDEIHSAHASFERQLNAQAVELLRAEAEASPGVLDQPDVAIATHGGRAPPRKTTPLNYFAELLQGYTEDGLRFGEAYVIVDGLRRSIGALLDAGAHVPSKDEGGVWDFACLLASMDEFAAERYGEEEEGECTWLQDTLEAVTEARAKAKRKAQRKAQRQPRSEG